MIEIIPANKRHIASMEALAKERTRKTCTANASFYYLACTVLKKYSWVAIESGEVIGFLLAFKATAQNYLWLHEITVKPTNGGQSLSSQLLSNLEEQLKSIWNTPIKSIKVALGSDQMREKDFYERHRYRFTRNDEALGKEIYQKRVII